MDMMIILQFLYVILPIYIVAFILYTIRALKGPTIPDHVLAIDAMSYDLAAFLVVLSIIFREPILIGTAIVLALWIYSLDIYISKYLEKKEVGE
ncbi:multiple resistance and pH regulation protein F [Staphylothermus marinus F1]|uniref:Multiple resistance and pH regulation protein F n=2 Tax=Staphylothermus marinus TaxID=2280 RepID=A3DKH5_STAMF|nr:multiple resistance and pH regulation protein F [Staphylothermus marinus F1]